MEGSWTLPSLERTWRKLPESETLSLPFIPERSVRLSIPAQQGGLTRNMHAQEPLRGEGGTQPSLLWQSISRSVLGRRGLARLRSLPALRPNAGTRTFSPTRGLAEGFVGHISPKAGISLSVFDGEPRGGRVPGLSVKPT